MSIELFLNYMDEALGIVGDGAAEAGSQDELGELIWHWIDYSKHAANGTYNPKAEGELDFVLEHWAKTQGEWGGLSNGALRVLSERVRQKIILGQMPGMVEVPTILPLKSLDIETRRFLAAVLWLHQMELPFAVQDRVVH